MQRRPAFQPLTELVAMGALLTSYIWGWGSGFLGDFTLCLILYLAIGIAAHVRARERPADLGLRLDTLRPAGRDAVLVTVLIGLVLLGTGALLGSLDFPPLVRWPRELLDGVVWGTLQQYGLLCIFYRRFGELLPGTRRLPAVATAAMFALFHLPNPFLTLTAFAAGGLSCWLYRRSPNVIVLGIMHGVIAFLIVGSIPESVTAGMRVGPGYYSFHPAP